MNCRLKLPPPPRVALLNAPSSAVTVCGALSSLVHLTVVPFVTVRFAGENAKSTIEAASRSLAGGGEVGFGVGFGVGAGVAAGFGVAGGDAVGFGVGCAVGAGVVRAVADGAAVGLGVGIGDAFGDAFGDALGAADWLPRAYPFESVLLGEAPGGRLAWSPLGDDEPVAAGAEAPEAPAQAATASVVAMAARARRPRRGKAIRLVMVRTCVRRPRTRGRESRTPSDTGVVCVG